MGRTVVALANSRQIRFSSARRLPPDRFDRLTKVLHWIFAVGILYALAVGYGLHVMRPGPTRDAFSHLNMSLATVLIVLFPLRLIWRLVRRQPAPPQGLGPPDLRRAQTVQSLLYALILIVLATGFLMVPGGYRLFGVIHVPTPFAKGAATDLFFILHRISCAMLTGLVGLHLAGVVLHTLVRPIGLIRRMI